MQPYPEIFSGLVFFAALLLTIGIIIGRLSKRRVISQLEWENKILLKRVSNLMSEETNGAVSLHQAYSRLSKAVSKVEEIVPKKV